MKRSRHLSRPFTFLLLLTVTASSFVGTTPVYAEETNKTDYFAISRELKERMKLETRRTIDFIERYHYKQSNFSQLESSEILRAYMEQLDGNHTMFLQSDYEDILERFESTLKPVYLREGALYPAFAIFELFRERAFDRINWVYDALEGDFDFTLDETYIPDREDMDWPADEAAADDLWRRKLKYELIAELLDGETLEKAKERLSKRYERSERGFRMIERHEVQEYFLNAYAGLYDPHTSFFSVESAEDFNIMISNSLVGIGAVLNDEDGYCTIRELIPGGPAEASGDLYPGDKIVEVAQDGESPVDVVDMKLSHIVKMIRGEKGSTVKLTVIPALGTGRKVVELQRDEIKLTANLAKAEVYNVPLNEETTVPIGVIQLPSFYGGVDNNEDAPSTTEDVEELITKLKAMNVQGIVLDLRRNGGGLLSEAIKLTGLFIRKGPVVMVRYTDGKVRKDWDEDPKVAYDGPLAVLVSRNSASASEIVAGALQSLDRAVIIGDASTHGKGTVQAPLPLDRGSPGFSFLRQQPKLGTVKVTIQKFYLPNGASTQKEGVRSDIRIPSYNDFLPIGESDLDNALVWDQIEPAEFDFDTVFADGRGDVDEDMLATLNLLSNHRRETLPEFDYLQRNLDFFEAKQEQKAYSLNLETRRARKEADKQFTEAMQDERDALAHQNTFALEEVRLALTAVNDDRHQAQLRSSVLPDGRSRINQYYQKVFYYQADENAEIKEVRVENFDYERLEKNASEIAATLSEAAPVEIKESVVEAILQDFKTSDRGSDFQVEQTFLAHLPDRFDAESVNALLPTFYSKLVELDPDILLERSKLDIQLRESLRVLVDWIEYDKGRLSYQSVAQMIDHADNS